MHSWTTKALEAKRCEITWSYQKKKITQTFTDLILSLTLTDEYPQHTPSHVPTEASSAMSPPCGSVSKRFHGKKWLAPQSFKTVSNEERPCFIGLG